VILKIPMSVHALGAFAELKKANVETFCTTIFTLNQAVLAANAGVTHLLPFCEPFIDVNKDSTELIRELKSTFDGWENRPFITAALVRSVTTAHKAIKDGADGIIIFWPIFEEMIRSKMTDEWNKIFLDNWNDIYDSGNLDGIKYKP
jgi:transaldolase